VIHAYTIGVAREQAKASVSFGLKLPKSEETDWAAKVRPPLMVPRSLHNYQISEAY